MPGSRFLAVLALTAAVLALAPGARAGLGDKAGVAAAVRGQVQQISYAAPRSVGRIVASGDDILLGDRIATGPDAGLQIMLLDQTVFTIGPESALVIDEFVYDPATSGGKVGASILKGTFRFVSGKVAAKDPRNMRVKLPVGYVGVRGTTVMGETDGKTATVALIGAGPRNNAGVPPGRIVVGGGGGEQEVFRAGYFVDIAGPGARPTSPRPLPPGVMARWSASLATARGRTVRRRRAPARTTSAAPSASDAGETAATEDETTADAEADGSGTAEGGSLTEADASILEDSGQSTASALETSVDESGTLALVAEIEGSVMDATKTVPSGVYTVTSGTIAMSGISAENAHYKFNYLLDMGARTASGQVDITLVSGFATAGAGSFPLLVNPFASLGSGGGSHSITESGVVGGLGGTITVDYAFIGDEATLALQAISHTVNYSDGTGDATGSAVTPAVKVGGGGSGAPPV